MDIVFHCSINITVKENFCDFTLVFCPTLSQISFMWKVVFWLWIRSKHLYLNSKMTKEMRWNKNVTLLALWNDIMISWTQPIDGNAEKSLLNWSFPRGTLELVLKVTERLFFFFFWQMGHICINLDPTGLDCIKNRNKPVRTRLSWTQLDSLNRPLYRE